MGYALTAYPIGVENGWVSRTRAVDRTLTTLKFFRDMPMGPQRTGKGGYKGFYYHFLDMQQGHRYDSWVELSSVDTALLMMGVLFAQSYYTGDDSREKEIRAIADTLYKRVDWPWLQQRAPLISMGWFPEWLHRPRLDGLQRSDDGLHPRVGSPTHPVSPDAWTVWTRTYDNDWRVPGRIPVLRPAVRPPVHPCLDRLPRHRDAYMRERGSTYFLNSRSAALAQREYAIANPAQWKEYGENVWV